MKSIVSSLVCVLFVSMSFGQNHQTMTAKPLRDVVKVQKKAIPANQELIVPLITWGGDVATIFAQQNGIFKRHGLKTKLKINNDFPSQIEDCLSGKTPFLRGTMGMVNAASEVFKANGIELKVIYQLTWSNGGDALVARKSIKKPKNLKGKHIALQLYGPHMDYMANILNSANIKTSDVNLHWYKELTLPAYDPGNNIVDPVSAFTDKASLDAVMCIIPDAMNLTSGGSTGTGSEGSVKGAKILLSTKTASRIISDVYVVRSDYLAKNKDTVLNFVKSLMKAEEELKGLLKNKASQRSTYQQLMVKSADLLLGAPQAIPDVEALLGDCEFVGFNGNYAFFTGKGTTRTAKTLTKEIQKSFISMGLLNGTVPLTTVEWDFLALAKGLTNASTASIPQKKKFDTKKVAAKIEQKIAVEPTTWAEEGTLFQIEIGFAPNQSEFSESEYANDFKKALSISETYGGALIIIEGHSDPMGILRARQKNKSSVEIQQMEQVSKNLSLTRSQEVRTSYLAYCKKQGIQVDSSQFIAVGLGVSSPKFSPPRTKEEWAANRRVVFRIKQVEAELSEFIPLD